MDKAKKFKACKTEMAEFTLVNEHIEVEAQRRISKILSIEKKRVADNLVKLFLIERKGVLGCGPATCSFFN